MSLSNPTLTNPAQHFFQWGGSQGLLTWWNKEEKKNVQVKLPFEFIVLDELATITGYSKQNESGFWANEVRNISNDELYVRTKKGPFEAGLYASLAQTRAKGGKYAKSIYLAHKVNGEWIIGNFKAAGSALSAWIEFSKAYNVQSGKVVMTRGEQQDAPTGKFYAPEFKFEKWTDEEYGAALNLDKELQIYLSRYLSAPKVDDDGFGTESLSTTASPEEVADFERRKASAASDDTPPAQPDVIVEDLGDEPINLDDIPF